jgi:hypothetical protein
MREYFTSTPLLLAGTGHYLCYRNQLYNIRGGTAVPIALPSPGQVHRIYTDSLNFRLLTVEGRLYYPGSDGWRLLDAGRFVEAAPALITAQGTDDGEYWPIPLSAIRQLIPKAWYLDLQGSIYRCEYTQWHLQSPPEEIAELIPPLALAASGRVYQWSEKGKYWYPLSFAVPAVRMVVSTSRFAVLLTNGELWYRTSSVEYWYRFITGVRDIACVPGTLLIYLLHENGRLSGSERDDLERITIRRDKGKCVIL